MSLSTLTKREEQWRARAREAVEREEEWEACPDCLRYHPVGHEGGCEDLENRLPRPPAELLG